MLLKAKDLMTKGTPTVPFDSLVADAIHYMHSQPLGFAAVSAAQDRFQGVLTEAGMVRIYLRYQAHKEKDRLILYRDVFEPIQLIQENEVFPEIVKKVMTAVGHRVFVIDEKGQIVGHITAKDLVAAIDAPEIATQQGGASLQNAIDKSFEQLKSQLYMYENFFSKSPFMMHSVNPEGKIQMANEIIHLVLGYEFGELIDKTIFDLYPKEYHQNASEGIKTIFDQGYHKAVESKMLTKTGEVIPVELVSRALFDQLKKPIGTTTVSRPLEWQHLLRCLPGV